MLLTTSVELNLHDKFGFGFPSEEQLSVIFSPMIKVLPVGFDAMETFEGPSVIRKLI